MLIEPAVSGPAKVSPNGETVLIATERRRRGGAPSNRGWPIHATSRVVCTSAGCGGSRGACACDPCRGDRGLAGTPDYETLAGERSVIEAVIPEAMTATGPGVSCSAGAAPSRRARSTEAVSAAQPMFYTTADKELVWLNRRPDSRSLKIDEFAQGLVRLAGLVEQNHAAAARGRRGTLGCS